MKTLLNIWLDDQGVINAQTDYSFGRNFKRADLRDWENGRYQELARFVQAQERVDLRRIIMLLDDARTDPRTDYRNLHPELEKALVDWRRKVAEQKRVAPYMVISLRTLLALADAAPRTYSELMRVPGIGFGLSESYGEELLSLTGVYADGHE